MTTRTERALKKWPNVPDLYGWLRLTRRGEWRLRGEPATHPRVRAAIAANYHVDPAGRWYFQNGPQRGFVALDYTPRVFRLQDDGDLLDQTGRAVVGARALYFDEEGAAVLDTDDGAGVIDGADLEWVLARLHCGGVIAGEAAIAEALAAPDDADTALTLAVCEARLPVGRCDSAHLPARLGFVREPAPREADSA